MDSENASFPFDADVVSAAGEWASDFMGVFGPLMAHVVEAIDPIAAAAFLAGAFAAMPVPVAVQTDSIDIRLRVDGLTSLVRELGSACAEGRRAA